MYFVTHLLLCRRARIGCETLCLAVWWMPRQLKPAKGRAERRGERTCAYQRRARCIWPRCLGKDPVAYACRIGCAAVCDMLGEVMDALHEVPVLLDVVALLADMPEAGTVVGLLNPTTVLVEFSDDEGRAHAVVPCSPAALPVPHYAAEAA